MTAIIVIIVGVLGVGLAVSQLLRLKAYLDKPPPPDPPAVDPPGSTPE